MPSSSLVEVEIGVEVEVGVEVGRCSLVLKYFSIQHHRRNKLGLNWAKLRFS